MKPDWTNEAEYPDPEKTALNDRQKIKEKILSLSQDPKSPVPLLGLGSNFGQNAKKWGSSCCVI